MTIQHVPEDAPCRYRSGRDILMTKQFQGLRTAATHLQQKLADVFPLVTLKLNNLSVLGMLDHSAITGKFLEKHTSVQHK